MSVNQLLLADEVCAQIDSTIFLTQTEEEENIGISLLGEEFNEVATYKAAVSNDDDNLHNNNSGCILAQNSSDAKNVEQLNSEVTVESEMVSEQELSDLAPITVCSVLYGLKKDSSQVNNLCFFVILCKIHESITNCIELKTVCEIVSGFTNQLKSYLNRIPGTDLPGKVSVFLKIYNQFFTVQGVFVKKIPDPNNLLPAALSDSMKVALVHFVEQGFNTTAKLLDVLLSLMGATVVPSFGKLTNKKIKKFLLRFRDVFDTVGGTVFLIPASSQSAGHNYHQSYIRDVVSFFKQHLQDIALPVTELALVLSRENPELLASIVDRTCSGILQLLLKDGSFRSREGLIMLQEFVVPAVQKSNVIFTKTTALRKKISHDCVCSSGTVVSVEESKGTLYCCQSTVCDNIFVLVKQDAFVNGVQGACLDDVLEIGEKVVFTTRYGGKRISDTAEMIKTVAKTKSMVRCLCKKKTKMTIFTQQISHANGISYAGCCSIFWNCRGTVEYLKGSKGVVKCLLNSLSTQYFNVNVTSHTWFVGYSGNFSNLSQVLSVNDIVEVDVCLKDETGFLEWNAACIRKLPPPKENRSLLWDCTGKIIFCGERKMVIDVDKEFRQKIQEPFLIIRLGPDSICLDENGSSNSFSGVFKPDDAVIFDAQKGNRTKAMIGRWEAKMPRKCKRPSLFHSMHPVMEDSAVVVALLEEDVNENGPATLTYEELKEISCCYKKLEAL